MNLSFNLVKSNICPGFRVNGTSARISRLKLNFLLVAYIEGFITIVEVCEFDVTIFANERLSFRFIFYNVYKVD